MNQPCGKGPGRVNTFTSDTSRFPNGTNYPCCVDRILEECSLNVQQTILNFRRRVTSNEVLLLTPLWINPTERLYLKAVK